MKKILFVAISATLLAVGCQKTEIVNPVGNPIGFSIEMGKITKAEGESTTPSSYPDAEGDGLLNLNAQNFRLWVYADYEDGNTAVKELDNVYDKMSNLQVTYQSSDDTWYPVGKEYYWPGVNKSLRFFALSGINLGESLSATTVVAPAITRTTKEVAGTDGQTTTVETVTPTLTVNEFTVNHDSPNADLMVADFVTQNQSNPQVALNFRHTLSKVQFLFKTLSGSDRDVFVQSISVTGINSKAKLTVSENTDESTKTTQPMLFSWTDHAEKTGEYKDDHSETPEDFPTTVEMLNSQADLDKTSLKLTNSAKEFATWLVIPQPIKDLQVTVRYIIGQREFETVFPLDKGVTEITNDDKTKSPVWLANQYIRYTVTLAPNLISFEPDVDEWKPTTDVTYPEK